MVTGTGGAKVITYDGYPPYTFVGAPPLSTKGNGVGGQRHVITLSAADISLIRSSARSLAGHWARPGNVCLCAAAY